VYLAEFFLGGVLCAVAHELVHGLERGIRLDKLEGSLQRCGGLGDLRKMEIGQAIVNPSVSCSLFLCREQLYVRALTLSPGA